MNTLPIKKRTTPFSMVDCYKLSHHSFYGPEVTWVYSNFTPRKCRLEGVTKYVFFGLQAALLKINEKFQKDFFDLSSEDALNDFKTFYRRYLNADDEALYEKVAYVHSLGYLPLEVYALPEGSAVPHGVPVFTICNTDPECAWLTNLLETWLSCEIWKLGTSATMAWEYRKVFDKFASLTSDLDFMPAFQGHDFSFRGMSGVEDAKGSGAAHALSFNGSDTCVALEFIDDYYPGSPADELLVTSVKATEHSTASSSILMEFAHSTSIAALREQKYNLSEMEYAEYLFILRLLQENPTGILSYVTDTFDFWAVVTKVLPALYDEIMARDGKFVIRPDSSPKTPVEIIVGDREATHGTPEFKGLIECLAEIFGGTVNSKNYLELDSHIGAIYGDSITLEYQRQILTGLMKKGFSSTNIVLGIGSYTYQYVTRDTHGIAMKATAVGTGWDYGVPEQFVCIYKDPKTDNSGKKSARGLLGVFRDSEGEFELRQFEDPNAWHTGELVPVYRDGYLATTSFSDVRKILKEQK